MATQDRSRQQSAFSPQSGAQQGGGGALHEGEGGVQQQQRDQGQSLVAPGTWLGAFDRDYRASPFALMQRLTADMDRLFENFGMGMFSRGAWPFAGLRQGGLMERSAEWSPHVEMFEQADALVVQVELPGLRKQDVQARIDDDAIVVSGERRNETQRNDGGRYLSERSYGSFYRVIPLPEGTDADAAHASFRDGVLRIEVPLTSRARGRRLDIVEGAGAGSPRAAAPQQQQQEG